MQCMRLKSGKPPAASRSFRIHLSAAGPRKAAPDVRYARARSLYSAGKFGPTNSHAKVTISWPASALHFSQKRDDLLLFTPLLDRRYSCKNQSRLESQMPLICGQIALSPNVLAYSYYRQDIQARRVRPPNALAIHTNATHRECGDMPPV